MISHEMSCGRGRRKRRLYPAAEKLRIVAESYEPGLSVSVVARRHDINANQLFTWRRQAARGDFGLLDLLPPAAEFVSLDVVRSDTDHGGSIVRRDRLLASKVSEPRICAGCIEIVLPIGAVVRVDHSVDGRALHRVLLAVKGAL